MQDAESDAETSMPTQLPGMATPFAALKATNALPRELRGGEDVFVFSARGKLHTDWRLIERVV